MEEVMLQHDFRKAQSVTAKLHVREFSQYSTYCMGHQAPPTHIPHVITVIPQFLSSSSR